MMESNKENESSNGQGLDHDTYMAARHEYDQAELEVSGRYDKWILTLSGGALGLSITFIEKIAKNPTSETLIWLLLSWSCFVFSLLIALLSLLTSQSAIRENRKELDESYKETRPPRLKFPRWFTRLTNALNWGSLTLFVLGTAFLCIFSFKNIDTTIKKEGIKNEQKKSESTKREKDYNRRFRSSFSTEDEKKGFSTSSASTAAKRRKEINNAE